jgi:hypothetical protein
MFLKYFHSLDIESTSYIHAIATLFDQPLEAVVTNRSGYTMTKFSLLKQIVATVGYKDIQTLQNYAQRRLACSNVAIPTGHGISDKGTVDLGSFYGSGNKPPSVSSNSKVGATSASSSSSSGTGAAKPATKGSSQGTGYKSIPTPPEVSDPTDPEDEKVKEALKKVKDFANKWGIGDKDDPAWDTSNLSDDENDSAEATKKFEKAESEWEQQQEAARAQKAKAEEEANLKKLQEASDQPDYNDSTGQGSNESLGSGQDLGSDGLGDTALGELDDTLE